MPTYEYVCEKCNHQFEVFQSMKDPVLTVCPKELCNQKKWGKGKVRRQLGTGAGLLFKGSGFYITDYRSEGYKTAAKKDVAPAASAAPATGSSSSSASSSSSTSSSKPSPTPVASSSGAGKAKGK